MDENECPNTELMADEGPAESTGASVEDVDLGVGHSDDDVLLVDSEGRHYTVVGGCVIGQETTTAKPVGLCTRVSHVSRP